MSAITQLIQVLVISLCTSRTLSGLLPLLQAPKGHINDQHKGNSQPGKIGCSISAFMYFIDMKVEQAMATTLTCRGNRGIGETGVANIGRQTSILRKRACGGSEADVTVVHRPPVVDQHVRKDKAIGRVT
ncbi:hypothetical protein QQF64_004608 [Cirrhinus molitorella]|uniref:Secreted protein n=1 Tax=Cirrhinus molitorella TaxID=172907 RepID=A0ABR3MGP1_9TELE